MRVAVVGAGLSGLGAAPGTALRVRLAALRAAGGRPELGDEQGNTHGAADAVVVTAPAPQAADLLERSPEPASRVAALRAVGYDPAVMMLLGLDPDDAAALDGRSLDDGLGEARSEGPKGGRLASDGSVPAVVRLGPAPSAELLDASDEEVMARTLPSLAAALGRRALTRAWAQVKRWRFAVPRGCADPAAVAPPGSSAVLAGDAVAGAAFGGAGHAAVYAGGLDAARHILASRDGRPA
jgi:predicted NAD/FAD-dependent oxidoreductase